MKKKKKEDTTVNTYNVDPDNFVTLKYGDIYKENRFNRLLKALRVYNMSAYKHYYFEFIPKTKEKVFKGEISDGEYFYELPSDLLFQQVHGKVRIQYTVEGHSIILHTIEPEKVLYECSTKLFDVYKGVVITCAKDRFKVDLLTNMKK